MLSEKEFWLEIVSIDELKYGPIWSRPISASGLKRLIITTSAHEVFITATLPNVYVEVGNEVYRIPYRPYLSFLTHLSYVEDCVTLNWLTDGF